LARDYKFGLNPAACAAGLRGLIYAAQAARSGKKPTARIASGRRAGDRPRAEHRAAVYMLTLIKHYCIVADTRVKVDMND